MMRNMRNLDGRSHLGRAGLGLAQVRDALSTMLPAGPIWVPTKGT